MIGRVLRFVRLPLLLLLIFAAARFTLGNRIMLSFGALFVLMLVMAAISWSRLRVMDDEALSMGHDSVPGLYLATTLRAAANEGYSTLERALFVDSSDAAAKQDLERMPALLQKFDQVSAEYQATLFRDADREHFRAFRAAWDQYLPQLNDAMRNAPTSKADAQATFVKLAPAWESVIRTANELVNENRTQADDSAKSIRDSVTGTEITLATALRSARELGCLPQRLDCGKRDRTCFGERRFQFRHLERRQTTQGDRYFFV